MQTRFFRLTRLLCHHGIVASVLLIAIAVLPSVAFSEPPTVTQAVGGNGGTPFRFQCPSGEFLIGIRAKAGQWIDRIGGVCAAWDPVRRVTLPPHDMRDEFGGAGGEWTRFGCPPNTALSGWLIEDSRGEDPHVVGNIAQEECRSLVPPFGTVAAQNHFIGHTQLPDGGPFPGHFKAAPLWARCKPGQLANGLYGGSGVYLDRVGLFCATPVVAQAAPPPVAAPPQHRGPMGKRHFTVATAKDDVDVYDQPDGDVGKVIGVMRQGEAHKVVVPSGGWSELADVPAPGRQGWVANDHLTFLAQ
jgi:hypothetical protein